MSGRCNTHSHRKAVVIHHPELELEVAVSCWARMLGTRTYFPLQEPYILFTAETSLQSPKYKLEN